MTPVKTSAMEAADQFALWLAGFSEARPGDIPQEVRDRLERVVGALVAARIRQHAVPYPADPLYTQTFGPLGGVGKPYTGTPLDPGYTLSGTSSPNRSNALAAEAQRLLEAAEAERLAKGRAIYSMASPSTRLPDFTDDYEPSP